MESSTSGKRTLEQSHGVREVAKVNDHARVASSSPTARRRQNDTICRWCPGLGYGLIKRSQSIKMSHLSWPTLRQDHSAWSNQSWGAIKAPAMVVLDQCGMERSHIARRSALSHHLKVDHSIDCLSSSAELAWTGRQNQVLYSIMLKKSRKPRPPDKVSTENTACSLCPIK